MPQSSHGVAWMRGRSGGSRALGAFGRLLASITLALALLSGLGALDSAPAHADGTTQLGDIGFRPDGHAHRFDYTPGSCGCNGGLPSLLLMNSHSRAPVHFRGLTSRGSVVPRLDVLPLTKQDLRSLEGQGIGTLANRVVRNA